MANVQNAYQIGQVRTGRVTRVAEFGAFVELEPGIEALAHVSTFAPTGRSRDWTTLVAPGTAAVFEILSIDPEKKRIGVKMIVDAHEAEDVRAYSEREDVATEEGFGSLADKLRGALKPEQH